MNDQTTTITDVRTVGVPVADQDRALEFYLDKLGFEKRVDAPLPQLGARWIEVAPRGAAITIALVASGEDLPTGIETGIRLVTPDATTIHAQLEAQGVEVGELLRWPGVPAMFGLRDQDHNGLEIVERA